MKLFCLNVLLLIGGILEKCCCQIEIPNGVQLVPQERINWQPVWDSDPKPGDPLRLQEIQNPTAPQDKLQPVWYRDPLTLEPIPSVVNTNPMAPMFPNEAQGTENLAPCDAPNGLGVRNLFTQAKQLLPLEQIRSIVRSAANDREVHAMMKFLNSTDYRQRVANLTQSREFKGLHDFACYKMNFDLKLHSDLIKDLLQLSELSKVLKNKAELQQVAVGDEVTSGLRGLLHNIRDVLPRRELRELFETLKRKDWYLERAVRTTKTYEYEAIVKLYRQHPDFLYLKKAWSDIGMPVDELWDLLHTALGWSDERMRESDQAIGL